MAASVENNISDNLYLQQLPFAVVDVVTKVHFLCTVRDIDLK